MAARSKAWVCNRLLAGIAGSNPIGGMDVCECFVLSGRGLCDGLITRPEESYRERMCVCVCVCVCVLSRNFNSEEAQAIKKKVLTNYTLFGTSLMEASVGGQNMQERRN